VVVAGRAGDGEAEEAAGSGVDAVVLLLGAERVEAEASFVFILIGQLIARDLGFDEGVPRHVGVEGGDDPVAIPERIGVGLVFGGIELVVGVARDIEPVTAPALAVTGRGEQAVDHGGEGVGGFVADEGVDLGGRGWETGQIEIRAADEGAAVGGLDRRESFFFELREDEAVNVAVRPFGVSGFGRRGGGDGAEGPETTLFGRDDVRGGFGAGPRRWARGLRL